MVLVYDNNPDTSLSVCTRGIAVRQAENKNVCLQVGMHGHGRLCCGEIVESTRQNLEMFRQSWERLLYLHGPDRGLLKIP